MLFCVSCLLILWTLSKWYCVKCSRISQISVSYLSQGSAATHLRCDGQCDIGFVANVSKNTTVKEFWKSVNICQSYKRMYSGTVFLTHGVGLRDARADEHVKAKNVRLRSINAVQRLSAASPSKYVLHWLCGILTPSLAIGHRKHCVFRLSVRPSVRDKDG